MPTVFDQISSVSDQIRKEYTFDRRSIVVPGGRMSYVDWGPVTAKAGVAEGPIVFVHGNGEWSYAFRRLIRQQSESHRCVAMDHIGFGYSERPHEFSYSPAAHARNFKLLMDSLDLTNITLVVHDLGGPIGLSYALENPERVDRIVLMNTWMWDQGEANSSANLISTGLMRWVADHTHLMNRVVRHGYADKRKFNSEVVEPQQTLSISATGHHGAWSTLCESQYSGAWMAELWSQREILRDKPLKMIWGMQDSQLGERALNKWWHDFPLAEVERIADAGRYVLEEHPEHVMLEIRQFLSADHQGGFLA